jgi:hypothetical protein
MKRIATIALAVLFVSSLSGAIMAERTALSITGEMTLMSAYEENTGAADLGGRGVDARVEQRVNLYIDADMTDNVTVRLGLEEMGAWGDTSGLEPIDRQAAELQIDEAYVEIKELYLEQLTVRAGVQEVEYSLRDDGDATFVSIQELGAWKATLDYDPLYVDALVGTLMETRNTWADMDVALYLLGIEYYLENEGKVQITVASVSDEDADISLTQYSVGVLYNINEDLQVYGEVGGQSGDVNAATDVSATAYNLGVEYTFANVARTPYVGLAYQVFTGTDEADEVPWQPLGDVDSLILAEADRDLRDHGSGNNGKFLVNNYSAIRILAGCVVDEKTTLDGQIAILAQQEEDGVSQSQTGAGGGLDPLQLGLANTIPGVGVDGDIGTEIDAVVTHQLTEDVTLSAGIGYLSAGDAIDEDVAGGEDEALVAAFFKAVVDF